MKRYDEDVIYPENREEYYAGMIEESKGKYVKYEEANALLTKFADAIVENHKQYNGEREKCVHCCGELPNWLAKKIEHEEDCIVLKAEQYLKE